MRPHPLGSRSCNEDSDYVTVMNSKNDGKMVIRWLWINTTYQLFDEHHPMNIQTVRLYLEAWHVAV